MKRMLRWTSFANSKLATAWSLTRLAIHLVSLGRPPPVRMRVRVGAAGDAAHEPASAVVTCRITVV